MYLTYQMATSSQGLKAFVSETEIEEKKQKRQEEWEKVRKPDDPEGITNNLVSIRSFS